MEAVDVSGELDVLKSDSADEKFGASQRRKVFITDDPNPLPRSKPQRSIYTSDLEYEKSAPPKPPKPLYLPDPVGYPAYPSPHYGYPVINYAHPNPNLVRPGYAGHPPYPYPATYTMALNVSSSSAKEWVQKQRDKLQPWQEFLNTSKVSKPRSAAGLTKRITQNLEKFQSNYLLVSIGLFIYCIITSPLLLIACAFLVGGCYFIQARQSAGKVVLLGRELTVGQQYLAVGLISIPMFFMAGGDLLCSGLSVLQCS
ncbi:prenylated Rab acceptor protein 1-like isoform X2 [Ptychodera flava]|uniref:prenylated Rab acceptor protein 1-like isoform X2 n=1 Tax=Ptychodera flava TaxID=63121 RepID=UPI00396A656B